MNRMQIATRLALREVGLDLNLDDFNDRLMRQKAIYLLQAAGVHLGYSYSW